MSILPIPSLNALLTKAGKVKEKTASVRDHQRHAMHYLLKGMGYLPTPVLERFNRRLKAVPAEQYPHTDAHLRWILATSNQLKQPLTLDTLPKLRKKFGKDMVSMQAPEVWLQPNSDSTGTVNASAVNNSTASAVTASKVSWQDKLIKDADGGDMTIRCYQQHKANLDQVVMLFFHGGGFCIGDIDTHHEFCHAVCHKTGWSVVSVDYRLAPEHPAPTALRDCISAYAWLGEHCHTLDALSSRIVLAGDSAGGCLAILSAQQISAPDMTQWLYLGLDAEKIFQQLQSLPKPLAQLPLYPVTDIEANHPSWTLYHQGFLLDHNDIEVFDAAYMQQSALLQSHPLISPMHGDSTQLSPSYIITAELDILRDEALAYADKLQQDELKVESYTALGAPHGFIHLMSIHKGLGNETDYIIEDFGSFVRRLLAPKGD